MHRPALLALVLLHLLAWLGGSSSPAELAAAFLPFYLLAFLLCGAWALRVRAAPEEPPPRRAPWIALALLGAGIDAAQLAPLWLGETPAPASALVDALPLRVYFANVKGRLGVQEAQLASLRASEADVVVLAEVGGPWLEALAFLEEDLPYTFARPRDDDFGLALFSRWPLLEAEALLLDGKVPTLSVLVDTPAGPLRVFGTHAPPPHWRPLRHARQLEELATVVAASPEPVVVAGDFNATPWSPRLRQLLRRTGLRRSGAGHGYLATWAPRWFPVTALPIDHVLVRGPIEARGFATGPRQGSDHRSVSADLSLGRAAVD
ncbi:MAG TPA: endonuclease/exonuclease/phosphatase family protein [Planctomycetota bacterium]